MADRVPAGTQFPVDSLCGTALATILGGGVAVHHRCGFAVFRPEGRRPAAWSIDQIDEFIFRRLANPTRSLL